MAISQVPSIHEPAACGARPAQHARVHKFPAETEAIGAIEERKAATNKTVSTTRAIRIVPRNVTASLKDDVALCHDQGRTQRGTRRRRRAFAITEIELKLIAAAAIIGLNRIPKIG